MFCVEMLCILYSSNIYILYRNGSYLGKKMTKYLDEM